MDSVSNGNVAHPQPSPSSNVADVSSDESTYSTKDENTRLSNRRSSHQSRSSNADHPARTEDKPSFSSIVDRRGRKGLIPLFFERASGNVFNPCFDSDILETEFQRFSVSVDKIRFQIALLYIAFASLTLSIFFGATHDDIELAIGAACSCAVALIIFIVTKFVKLYSTPKEARILSVFVSILFAVAEVVTLFRIEEKEFTYSARFGIATCVIIVIYTMMPALPLYASMILALVFSVGHEIIASFPDQGDSHRNGYDIAIVILLHFCIHLLGITIVFMAQVRKRSTFWRVGQSVVAKQDLDIEQRVKNRMIRSVMPNKVAEFLILNGLKQKRDGNSRQKRVAFRPFAMYKMENVSILFADIVGFTKMSAKKEADHLVHLLNMLFGKFDELTEINNCEKISTLGDCYYCVAGCPETSEYHAISCVEMGLDIVEEIKKFCVETGEDVDMRVGIHTGNVLCGIVGDRRRRFDVWSNDVAIANKMESAGRPGCVHFTSKTLDSLGDCYLYEKGAGISRPDNEGGFLESYFITGRTDGSTAYKPWQKKGLTTKQSIGDSQELLRGQSNSMANVLAGLDPEQKKKLQLAAGLGHDDSSYGAFSSPSHIKMNVVGSDNIEKDYLAKAAFASPISPISASNIQKQLAKTPLPYPRLSATFNFTYGMTLNEALMRDAMRASNDNQLVRLMHEKKIQKEYFFNPPLHWWSLNFLDEIKKPTKGESDKDEDYGEKFKKELPENIEAKYRDEGLKGFKLNPKVTTFASPKIHFFFDVLTAVFTILIMIIACCLFLNDDFPITFYVVVPIVVLIMTLLFVVQCVRFSPTRFPMRIRECAGPLDKNSETGSTDDPSIIELHDMRNHNHKNSMSATKFQILKQKLCSPWNTAHLCGGLILCLPIVVVFSMYRDCTHSTKEYWTLKRTEYFSMFMYVSLLHFCSFTQLSSLMKTGISYVWCIAFVVVLLVMPVQDCMDDTSADKKKRDVAVRDIAIVAILQIVLVTVLNRIHEQGVRANFYGDKEAAEQKNIAVEQKQVADWLIQDMFPRHVSDQLKYTKNCSKNYETVGVLFATIVNFSEFYEENFEGGIECIRILHELVADFDKELMKYENIEKIKTVYGTTFMAASGLKTKPPLSNKQQKSMIRPHKYLHLKALVDFALGLQKTLNEFNENMLGFKFRLRCGVNAGPVTAGVIGTMKPQYDIWGDTVNLASRMESLGVGDKIQVDEHSMKKLTDFYTFELRGTISVKGKSDMATYLLVDRKPNAPLMDTVEE